MRAVRRATVADAPELTRLREILLAEMGQDVSVPIWRAAALAAFTERLAPGRDLTAFVIDGDGGELAASAVGTIFDSLPGPNRPDGRTGWLLNLATAPEYRGCGYARAACTALLDWFHGQGVRRIEIHASTAGEALAKSLGFTEPASVLLTWAEPRRL
ncbi:MAG TPA: GNAT family N-acetyltransferase [Sporichthyaceae bacterium]|jgi:RimJ/RimL family protein N-acetyltransferase|nr:GNAT family N-acetyltransferase [Sporichthyaceae bacterium]